MRVGRARVPLRRLVVLLVAAFLSAALPACTTAGAVPEIDWSECAGVPERHPVHCGRVSVPVDWAEPDSGERVHLRVAKWSAARPEQRIGTLLFNPGGPGGSAAGIVASRKAFELYFPPRLRDRFDIVGVDPRGVGDSRPLRCAEPPHDPSVTRFPADHKQAKALAEHNAGFAESCRAESGEFAATLGTETVARDIDAVRQALGQGRISFLGISYGTMLAQSYAESFGHHLRALVLDGPVDRSLSWRRLAADSALAVQDGVNRFVAWCARAQECAVREPGAGRALERVQDRATEGRLTADGRSITVEEVGQAVNSWLNLGNGHSALAEALREALDSGDATELLRHAPFNRGNMYATYRAIICQDVARPAPADLPAAADRMRALGPSLRGTAEFWDIASGCAGWPLGDGFSPHPWQVPETFPETMLLSGAHDVATPRRWARSVHRQIPNSTLVRWDGDGHTAWLNDKGARDKAVRYLVTGTS